MKINNLQFKKTPKLAILSAEVTVDGKKPVNIYFEVDSEYADFIAQDYSPFYTATMIPGMNLNQEMIIKGAISEKLLAGSQKNQVVLNKWEANFKKIKINTLTKKDSYGGDKIGSFFSGGVDSFSTLIKNHQGRKEKIKYLILIHGFDIDLSNQQLFNAVYGNILKYTKSRDLKLVAVRTNLREITDPYLDWGFAHGGALAGVALLLRKKFKTLYIPSSYQRKQLFPWGSHPLLDKNWSTESLTLIHDGSDLTRIEKILSYIAPSPGVLKCLRVCWGNVNSKYNCGRCNKCVRTMIELQIAGVLTKAETFPRSLKYQDIENLRSLSQSQIIYIKETIAYLRETGGDHQLVIALQKSLWKSSHPSAKRKIIDYFGYLDGKYNKKRLYFFMSRMGTNL